MTGRRTVMPLLPAGILAGLLGLLVAAAFGHGNAPAYSASAQAQDLTLREVTVSGHRHGDRQRIDAILEDLRGQPVTQIDLAAARRQMLALPWIADATLKLQLPDRLHVALREREAAAVWQRDGRRFLVDRDGHVLMSDPPRRWNDRLLVIGDGAARAADDLLQALDDRPGLKTRLRSATYVAERRWTLQLTSGIEVALPEDGWPDAGYCLSDALDRLSGLESRYRIGQRAISRIDLRFADRLVLRRLPGTVIADTDLEHST